MVDKSTETNARLPRVSIGLPVFNGEKYLATALDSLLAQTFGDFELIISDNASTDRTEEICRAYAALESRIRYYREACNRGIAWNFNRTFELARAEFFKWHAHDDSCAPTLLERAVEMFDRDPKAVLCYARPSMIDERGQWLPDDPATWRSPTMPEMNDCFDGSAATINDADRRGLGADSPARRYYGVLLQTVWCLESYGVVRTAVMRTTGRLRPYCGAEKVFLAELALRGKLCEIPEVLFFPRRHAQQYTLLNSGSAQRRSVRPGRSGRRLPVPRQLRSTAGYLMLLPAAPISWCERMRSLGVLLRYVFQLSKWKRIVEHTLEDVNITGGYLKLPENKPVEIIRSGQGRSSTKVESA